MIKLIKPYQEDSLFHYVVNKGIKKHKAVPFNQSLYDKLTLDFDGKPYGEVLKADSTSGYCYFYATLLCKALPNSILVLGVLNALNSDHEYYYEEFGHAWVEYKDYVYDTSSKTIFNKQFYYKRYDATVKESYTHEQVNQNDVFFKLGINAIKDREDKVDTLFRLLPKDYSPDNNLIKSSIERVNSSYVLDKIQHNINKLEPKKESR